MSRTLTFFCCVLVGLAVGFGGTAELCVIGFNLESGDSETATLIQTMATHSDCDLWGLSEVLSNDQEVEKLERQGAEHQRQTNFNTLPGTTGGNDRLAIMYDTTRLMLFGVEEPPAPAIARRRMAPRSFR
jgi:hypothetical protein